ncbi:MAG: hypothetical protein WC415_00060 [Patescibacteria group bacterium]|jgi:hypothetical protein
MFAITKDIERMLEQSYQDVLNYCCPCILEKLKIYDSQMLAAEKEIDQIFNARLGADLIEACSELTVKGTIEKDGVPVDKINCSALMTHRLKEGGGADFRIRWKVMLNEIDSEFNKESTKTRFNLEKGDKTNFIQRYLNYRLWGAFYNFGERHRDDPGLYINLEERRRDEEILKNCATG